jgi:hypothetical protein
MDKVTFIADHNNNEHALIEHSDGSFTSMLKSTYDAMQANSTLPSNSSDFSQPIGGNE